jgi:hypothetical protein
VSLVDVLLMDVLLMVEYVETGLLFWSKLVQEDVDEVDEVVLIEDVSEETLEVRVRRENGLEVDGMVCEGVVDGRVGV